MHLVRRPFAEKVRRNPASEHFFETGLLLAFTDADCRRGFSVSVPKNPLKNKVALIAGSKVTKSCRVAKQIAAVVHVLMIDL